MVKRALFFFVLLLFGFSGLQTSQAQVGITAVPFLQIEPDSRGAGMGNTGVAIADNAAAMYWNPAGFAFQSGNQVSITHSKWLPNFDTDLFYDYLVGKYTVEGIGTIGGHLTYLNLGEQVHTDPTGEELGTFTSYELAGGLSYGYQVNKNLGLGTGLRFIYSKLVPPGTEVGGQEAQAGTSVAIDLSGLYRTDRFQIANRNARFRFGANLSNLGPGIQYSDRAQKDPLPTLLRFGWSYSMDLDEEGYNRVTLATDITKIMARSDTAGNTDGPFEALVSSWDSYKRHDGQGIVELSLLEQFMVGTGLEYWYNDLFAVRGGYYREDPKNGDRQYITLGAGLRYNIFGVDFSYIYTLEEDHPLANTIRFSVLLDI